MKCPYCGTELVWGHEESSRISGVRIEPEDSHSWEDWGLSHKCCGNCRRPLIVMIRHQFFAFETGEKESGEPKLEPLWPKTGWREPCPPEVPEEVAADYNEACAVIDISPTAAAALARRCMQLILVKAGGAPETKTVKDKSGRQKQVKCTLFDQIQFIIDNKRAPEWVVDDLHPAREVGNFAAHAKEDITGQVLRTEVDEAEWTLDVLRTLFDFYYIAPAKAATRRSKHTAIIQQAKK